MYKDDVNKGQSLVEFAVILPLLLVMMLGVLEVGYAIRSYVILSNACREVTRYLSRGLYDDGSMMEHLDHVVADEIDLEAGELAVVVHHYSADVGNPFSDDDDEFTYSRSFFGYRVIEPRLDEQYLNDYANTAGININKNIYERELLSAEGEYLQLLLDHKFDKVNILWSVEEIVAVEFSYRQPQLVGFFGNAKIPIYTYSVMRVNNVREIGSWER